MPFGLPLERYPSFRVTGLSLKGMRMNHPCLACFWARTQVLPCLRVPNVPKRQANATVQSLQRTRAFVLSLERPLYGFLMASLDDTGSQVD